MAVCVLIFPELPIYYPMKKFDRSIIPPIPNFDFETDLWSKGIGCVAGIDEAGRGALAGPVVAAALVFPPDNTLIKKLNGVRDSKQMTPKQREDWGKRLPEIALTSGVGFSSTLEVDELGILQATRLAMMRALEVLEPIPDYLLLDYVNLRESTIRQISLVKGDQRSLSIAAASILAKTSRDAWMIKLDAEYPGYRFATNKGYGTGFHKEALMHLGPCPIHRRTFKFAEK